jgi:hypothetical protein
VASSSLPIKTTEQDLTVLLPYLKSQVGWVPIEKIKSTIPPKHADPRKLDAMRYLGLIERDGENVKLTDDGREFAGADKDQVAEIMKKRLRATPLYHSTLEWMHHSQKLNLDKTEIANYWHDHHAALIGGAEGDALTDATVFFMRMVGLSGLGKFTAAGKGRDTNLAMDAVDLTVYAATVDPAPPLPPAPEPNAGGGETPASLHSPQANLSVSAGLNVTVEIHIAADAKPATIEEIFKNMRRYLIDGTPTTDGS